MAPAGLFVPLIVTGASYGRLVGLLFGSYSNLNHGLFAVLGCASLLGGSMRTTVSLCVIILELTNNLLLLPLIMLSLLISKTVGDAFNENVYDMLMRVKGFPYLEAHVEPYMRQLAVADVVAGPLQLFNGIEKISNIVHVLKTTTHNAFPVVDEPPFSESPVLFGLILRAHLITLLKKKAFLHTPQRHVLNAMYQFSAYDFAKAGLGHRERIGDIDLSDEEMNMFIDLHPYIQFFTLYCCGDNVPSKGFHSFPRSWPEAPAGDSQESRGKKITLSTCFCHDIFHFDSESTYLVVC